MMAKSHSIRKTAVTAALVLTALTAAVFTGNMTNIQAAKAATEPTGQLLSVQQDVQIARSESSLEEEASQLSYLEKADEKLAAEKAARKAAKRTGNRTAIRGNVRQAGKATGTFTWPVPSVSASAVTSGVGYRDLGAHYGVDIIADQGSAVVAADGGTVYISESGCTHYNGGCGCGGGFGNYVIIDHGNGYFTTYGHMTTTMVQTGDKVSKGQQLGTIGSTGYSYGYHLHFELRQGYYGTVLNPLDYVTA